MELEPQFRIPAFGLRSEFGPGIANEFRVWPLACKVALLQFGGHTLGIAWNRYEREVDHAPPILLGRCIPRPPPPPAVLPGRCRRTPRRRRPSSLAAAASRPSAGRPLWPPLPRAPPPVVLSGRRSRTPRRRCGPAPRCRPSSQTAAASRPATAAASRPAAGRPPRPSGVASGSCRPAPCDGRPPRPPGVASGALQPRRRSSSLATAVPRPAAGNPPLPSDSPKLSIPCLVRPNENWNWMSS